MAYNNYFPVGYNQPYYMPQQQAAANTGIIWCQGEAAAKSYPVAPNATVQLWDSESQTIYLKSADASGMPSMKVIDYTIRDTQNAQNASLTAQANNVTRDEFDALFERVNALRGEIDALTEKKSKKKDGDAA